ncbi:hypothetical protein M407DRAFT_25184 [Tulasnella calospora MUT 4182]|uniref:FYVE-type domain-containing protein n=1 Tax=Tulasnella calospora MUT 4182 TaxID=1051891 RepID=A0A0C3Q7C3_9AGAM|nr:hypothetical protein M407DRAFT_25184 [Tulasnella calospora MUT 4182]
MASDEPKPTGPSRCSPHQRSAELAVNASSSVSFPSSSEAAEPSPRSAIPPRPFLPFRRISLPANSELPVYRHRESVVSMHSFDSLPEEPRPQGSIASPATPTTPSKKPRPTSLQPPPRAKQRAESRRRRTEIISSHEKEGKRRSIVAEILDTERSYVEGLDLIYDLFLLPLIHSLDESAPILTRTELNSIFVNFIDIWNFHRSFLAALQALIVSNPNPPLAPLLSEHFPYLSLYTPFITAFPDSVSAITSLTVTNPQFNTFLKTQQSNPRCKLLTLRDWLLSIVQRCPRYLLLLKDLISCTEPLNDEYEGLTAVHALVSKITSALNTSLHSHTQTLQLLAIQRSTPNLPFPLISPGRTLVKRGTLLKVDREQRLREFLLLSDSLVWLSKANEREWEWTSRPAISAMAQSSTSGYLGPMRSSPLGKSSSNIAPFRPTLGSRTRSKSDAELPTWRSTDPSGDEKWTYRGKIDLMDIEVVVSTLPGPGEGRKFDIFGPTESFAVYTSTQEERDSWVQAVRSAKASLLMTLNITQADSTLTSSTSNAHLRRTLQALPHVPESAPNGKSSGKRARKHERRRIVEHFIPPPWVPDARAESCMRCGRLFGLLRRRHHCRLCGRVVCADCSTKTFFISDPETPDQAKPARACNMCYESIFPILPPSPTVKARPLSTPSSPTSVSFSQIRPSIMHIPTLPDIPSHRSIAGKVNSHSDEEVLAAFPSLPPPSPEPINGVFPSISSSLPNHLPTSPSLLPIPTRESLFGDPKHRSSLASTSTSSPDMENLAQFTLPTTLPPPSSFTAGPAIARVSTSSETFATSGGSPSKSPERVQEITGRRRSRASLPAIRDSFYAHSSQDATTEDLPEDLIAELENSQSDPLLRGEADVALQKRNRRITFAPSSGAVHRAPVTIYPQKDDQKRFSLVLTGKGTVGRGAGLDIGQGEHDGDEGVTAVS